jgi:hypothetical protein
MSELLPQFATAPRVAEYIKEHTEPGERILVIGSEPEIYYFSERPACTRLVITYPLTGPYPYAEQLRNEFVNYFKDCRPRYIVYSLDDTSYTEFGQQALPFVNLVDSIVNSAYRLEGGVLDDQAKKGKVAAVRGNIVFIDVAGSQGVLPLQSFPKGSPATGSEVDVHVVGYDRDHGVLLLSRASPLYLILRRKDG